MFIEDLKKTLRQGDKGEIKNIFGTSSEPLTPKEVIQVLRLLLGRSNFDYEMVNLLKKRNCDLNMPLGDKKENPDQYRAGDYLASYGRLSPRLIYEMDKAGYDFSKTNAQNEHAGFYLIASAPLNRHTIAALKAKRVDFFAKNNKGETVIDKILNVTHAFTNSHYKEILIQRLSPLFETKADIQKLVQTPSIKKMEELISNRLNEITAIDNSHIGIQDIYQDNHEKIEYAFSLYTEPLYFVARHKITNKKILLEKEQRQNA